MKNSVRQPLLLGVLWLVLSTALCVTVGAESEGQAGSAGNTPSGQDTRRSHTWTGSRDDGWIITYVVVPPDYESSEVRLKLGDDPRWAAPDFDDGDWSQITYSGVPTRTGVFWVRLRLRGPGDLPPTAYVKVAAAYDMYWDGRLVARSGVPGNSKAEEKPGPLETYIGIPAEWRSSGEHVVAFRLSTYRVGFPGENTDLQLWLAVRDPIMDLRRAAIPPALAEGAMLMIAIVSLIMWSFAARKTTLLLFVGLCLCAAATQAITVQRYGYTYTYDWHYPARLAAAYASIAMGACLLAFIGLFFEIPRWKWLLVAFVTASAVVMYTPREILYQPLSQKSGMILLFAFTGALLGTIRALFLKRTGASVAAIGAFIGFVAAWHIRGQVIEGAGFFPTFLPVLLGLAAAVALGLRVERQRAYAAQLTAARLEVELLKKNLQPHFLLNTLTAVTEVIEQSPGDAVKLIEDLASEFRTLARMSGEKQVALEQEVELCRVHLRVMSVRTGVSWHLATENIDPAIPVPPALFLTLIENGLLHQQQRGREAEFLLRMTVNGSDVRYTFISPGEVKARTKPGAGTGLRYVRARLEESFPGAWSFVHGATDAGWVTTIEVRGAAPRPGSSEIAPQACSA